MNKNLQLALLAVISTFIYSTSISQNSCNVRGWATQNGGTTGGGSTTPITVRTLAELQAEANSTATRVIYVSGNIGAGAATRVRVASNKTIFGLPGATLFGGFDIRGSNVILRNMRVRGPGSVDVNGVDAVNIQGGSNIWVDHCDIFDGQDGNLDISNGADLVTVSWTRFSYTSASTNHQFSNLVGSSDSRTTDRGRLRVTFINNWWGNGVRERMPRVRFGQVHVVNNYFNSSTADYAIRAGLEANILVEGNHFEGINDPIDLFENDFTAVTVRNNLFQNTTGNILGSGTAFTPPYSLNVLPPASVRALVTNSACGAGANMSSPTNCCGGGGGPVTTTYTLSTITTPSGGGTIIRSPNASSYNAGTVVTLTAIPAAGFRFTGWSGGATGTSASINVTMNANTSVTANFQPIPANSFSLTTIVSPAGGGNITRSPNAPTYTAGTVVTLTAIPSAGYRFTGWSGNASGTATTTTVVMSANRTVTANFAPASGGANTLRIDDKAATGTGYCSANGSRQNTYAGADGGYYVNLSNSSGRGISWAVRAGATGSYTLRWRYANGSASSATTARVLVNGTQVAGGVAFPRTATWTSRTTTASLTVNLAAGSNSVRLETISASEFANIDWIEITGNNPTEALCSSVPASKVISPVVLETIESNTDVASIFPSPSYGVSMLRFNVGSPEKVAVTVYSVDGKMLKTITDKIFLPGTHYTPINYEGLKPGVYYVRITAGGKQTIIKNVRL